MTAEIISGTEISRQIREELAQEIAQLKEKHNLVPGLATVLVGDDRLHRAMSEERKKHPKHWASTRKGMTCLPKPPKVSY